MSMGQYQAQRHMREISEIIAVLNADVDGTDRDYMEEQIHEMALAVEKRCGWTCSLDEIKASEFRIELARGKSLGVEIRGRLDEDGNPTHCTLLYYESVGSDTISRNEYAGEDLDTVALEQYARQFSFV